MCSIDIATSMIFFIRFAFGVGTYYILQVTILITAHAES